MKKEGGGSRARVFFLLRRRRVAALAKKWCREHGKSLLEYSRAHVSYCFSCHIGEKGQRESLLKSSMAGVSCFFKFHIPPLSMGVSWRLRMSSYRTVSLEK